MRVFGEQKTILSLPGTDLRAIEPIYTKYSTLVKNDNLEAT
jgi:hypothetical protein